MRARIFFGVISILLGLGVFFLYRSFPYLDRPIGTDIGSITRGEVIPTELVQVQGKLRLSDWIITELEEETRELRGFNMVYSLSSSRNGEEQSIWVTSDRQLEEGESVTITGELLHNAYGLHGYLIVVETDQPLRYVMYTCTAVLVLIGLSLVITGLLR
jgi:hypothetical protein